MHDPSLSDEERDTKLREAVRTAERSRTELNALFAKADEHRRTRSVPDYLCGNILLLFKIFCFFHYLLISLRTKC